MAWHDTPSRPRVAAESFNRVLSVSFHVRDDSPGGGCRGVAIFWSLVIWMVRALEVPGHFNTELRRERDECYAVPILEMFL